MLSKNTYLAVEIRWNAELKNVFEEWKNHPTDDHYLFRYSEPSIIRARKRSFAFLLDSIHKNRPSQLRPPQIRSPQLREHAEEMDESDIDKFLTVVHKYAQLKFGKASGAKREFIEYA